MLESRIDKGTLKKKKKKKKKKIRRLKSFQTLIKWFLLTIGTSQVSDFPIRETSNIEYWIEDVPYT